MDSESGVAATHTDPCASRGVAIIRQRRPQRFPVHDDRIGVPSGSTYRRPCGCLPERRRPRLHPASHDLTVSPMTEPASGPEILRYAAFAADAHGGNPAGIVLDARGLDDAAMQRIASQVGDAETAFVVERAVAGDAARLRLRYFSPLAEVPFCGHATVATAVALAEREGVGTVVFDTPAGPVSVVTSDDGSGGIEAAFTSVEPSIAPLERAVLAELLGLLGLARCDLDPGYPPRAAFSGNWHPILVLRDRARFDAFSFDPGALRRLMDAQAWTGTVTVLLATSPVRFQARNLFPVGVMSEDPATGSAAAALGGYLRATGRVDPPARVRIHQGMHVGRPSLLVVDIPPAGGIVVRGTATAIG